MGSVCNGCGLPTDLCVCQELAKEETRIVVRFEKRRFNKPTTIIEGLTTKKADAERIVKNLKTKLACGGAAKEGYLLLQGDHRDVLKSHLVQLGYNESSIEIQ